MSVSAIYSVAHGCMCWCQAYNIASETRIVREGGGGSKKIDVIQWFFLANTWTIHFSTFLYVLFCAILCRTYLCASYYSAIHFITLFYVLVSYSEACFYVLVILLRYILLVSYPAPHGCYLLALSTRVLPFRPLLSTWQPMSSRHGHLNLLCTLDTRATELSQFAQAIALAQSLDANEISPHACIHRRLRRGKGWGWNVRWIRVVSLAAFCHRASLDEGIELRVLDESQIRWYPVLISCGNHVSHIEGAHRILIPTPATPCIFLPSFLTPANTQRLMKYCCNVGPAL